MTMFLIQSLLWLLAAFLLGYGVGRWLKGVFCKRKQTQTKLETEKSHMRVPVTTAAVAAGTAATAALARSREPVKPTVTVKPSEVKAPVVTVKAPELKATVTPLKTADINLPKVDVTAPKVDLDLSRVDVNLPKVDVSLPTVDVTIPKLDLDLPTVDVKAPNITVPKLDVSLPEVDLELPKVDATIPEVDLNLPKIDVAVPKLDLDLPTVDVKAPDITVPKLDVSLPEVDLNLPKIDVAVPKLDLDLPTVDVKAPDITVPKLDVTLPAVDAQLPELAAPKVEVKDIATGIIGLGAAALGVAAVKMQAPDGELALTVTELVPPLNVDVELKTLQMNLPDAEVDLSSVEWHTPKVSVDAVTVNVPQVQVDLPDTDLPKMDVGLAAANINTPEGQMDLTALRVDVPDTVVHLPEAGIELAHANVSAGWLELNTPEGLYTVEGAKVQGLDQPEGAVALRLTKPDGDVQLASFATDASGHANLAAVDVSASGVELQTTEIDSLHTGLSSEWLAGLKTAAVGVGLGAIAAKAGDLLVDTPKPVDESDGIESSKTAVINLERASDLLDVDIGTSNQGLDTAISADLSLAAARVDTIAAVQANLQSGIQPMIVDESDAIEAIKLAWDGELSPAELAAFEHTLLLRPGETGRLGLVTCSVTGANCVSLGGLEADLHAGDAMRSKLFNMAVTHNDDGNYVFSSLSKWMPDWLKSGDFSEHTDELTHLVWDNDSSVPEHAAGYQLILREGQYGNLGLVSCAVNEPGSVSLGGIVGSIAEGQTAISKLYGIFVERAGDVYTFKQFAKPIASGSWLNTAKAAAVAAGASVVAQASGVVDAVKEAVMPVTRSMTTDMLEPDLDWVDGKPRLDVQRLIVESHARRGSKLVSPLWDGDSGYDCGVIEGEESLVLKPGLYGKLGSVHCGVTKPGRVVVSGDVSALAEGEGVLFHLYNIVVCRDDEDNYRFERLKDLV